MTDRPILFQGAMVRAILDGSKTQTRRVVKPAPPSNTVAMGRWQDPGPEPAYWAFLRDGPVEQDHPFGGAELHGEPWRCPYGNPGDRLWVRESLRQWSKDPQVMAYAADDRRLGEFHDMDWPSKCGDKVTKAVPSIHMPRAWSRILLEITGVRVERLQDISEADADAEGCDRLHDDEPGFVYRDEGNPDWKICSRCGGTRQYTAFSGNGGALPGTDCGQCDTYAKRYRHLWESINGPGSWDANPWVWCIEFRRLP
jgi:hypothetical protein